MMEENPTISSQREQAPIKMKTMHSAITWIRVSMEVFQTLGVEEELQI
jgi:hypothetical protein